MKRRAPDPKGAQDALASAHALIELASRAAPTSELWSVLRVDVVACLTACDGSEREELRDLRDRLVARLASLDQQTAPRGLPQHAPEATGVHLDPAGVR